MDNKTRKILENIAMEYRLGPLTAAPTVLIGGLMHRMYRIDTESRSYAVKLLNPAVMARPDATANFARAERLEAELEKTAIPILPALTFGGRKMQEIACETGIRYCYIFPWFAGGAVMGNGIRPEHCAAVGKILAQIHGVRRQKITPAAEEPMNHDWDRYVNALGREKPVLARTLAEHRELLYRSQERGNRAKPHLPPVRTICHNDMDPKNVLWDGMTCRIIDLECLDMANPQAELLETALCWSGYDVCAGDPVRLKTFAASYREAGGEMPEDWEPLYDANTGRLDWLAYNLRRVLGEEEENRTLGETESEKTLGQIACLEKRRQEILDTLAGI